MKPLILQQKTESFLNSIYPVLKKFPMAEKFCLCQEIKQSCYGILRHIMCVGSRRKDSRDKLNVIDDELKLLLVLFKVAKGQRYITEKKLHELQTKIIELGRITGGLMKRY